MEKYGVGCGGYGIYAGKLNKIGIANREDRTYCTDNVINVVMEYLRMEAIHNKTDCYIITKEIYNGDEIQLKLCIKKPKKKAKVYKIRGGKDVK